MRTTRRVIAHDGYAMAVLLVGIGIMGIMMSVAMPVWHQVTQREKEQELIFRGNQYARAVNLFQRKNGNAYPPSLDVLVQQKCLRKKYKDPMVEDGVFQLIPAGAMQAGQAGVTMPSSGASRLQQQGSQRGLQQQGLRPMQTVTSGVQTVVTAIAGVVSKSTDKSIRIYNGSDHYNEWFFVAAPATGRGGTPLVPGGRGGRGQGGQGRGGQGIQGPGGIQIIRNPDGTTIIRGRGPRPPGDFDPTQLPPGQTPPGGRGRGRGGVE